MIQLYSLAALSGAILLFLIQPMFAKMTLPLMGGTPAVWNTAMVFYQVVLLLGYAYAHFSTRLLNAWQSATLHILLLCSAYYFLPFSISGPPPPADSSANTIWLLKVYTLSIGVPFFLVSTISPLLQKWFSQTSHPRADNPYFLYSASNLGSIASLLAYPVLFEPLIGLTQQANVWFYLYSALVLLIAICAWSLRTHFVQPVQKTQDLQKVAFSQKLRWMAMAFIPSSLMLSVTTHITTDLGSAPFIWVIPLALFLLTFVIVFARKVIFPHRWAVKSHSYIVLLAPILLYQQFSDFRIFLILHLLLFFASAMVCHGELVKIKPASEKLTEFYFFMSIGGALGGIFSAIVAPVVFNSVYEYPIGIVLACLARPVLQEGLSGKRSNDLLFPLVLALGLYILYFYINSAYFPADLTSVASKIVILASALLVFSFSPRPIRFAGGVAAMIVFGFVSTHSNIQSLETHRNFFGVQKIEAVEDQQLLLLRHGTTIHGVQHTDPARWTEPLSYYHADTPVGTVFKELNNIQDIALVGLGLGTLTCYGQPGQNWRIFEIDDLVVSISKDTRFFHHMELCASEADVIVGDARLSLEAESDNAYDLLIIDAFSSDSIPVHLLTKEALALYMAKLKGNGRLLMHISNRHLNLAPVLGNLVHDAGYSAFIQFYKSDNPNHLIKQSSIWVVLGKNDQSVEFLKNKAGWQALPVDRDISVWTDDFSNLFRSMIWRQR